MRVTVMNQVMIKKTRKKKVKRKKNDSTKDDIKTLMEKIEGLALGSRKF